MKLDKAPGNKAANVGRLDEQRCFFCGRMKKSGIFLQHNLYVQLKEFIAFLEGI
ncbi:hypothetical protein [Paenibacillus oralis]|uniref:hypothetical protein n=1 Tax=Paenibacillus oralis TaxID=2490856 RepID=UPI0015B25E42|nr:hypothetical protein [Paenibacillus oralis]